MVKKVEKKNVAETKRKPARKIAQALKKGLSEDQKISLILSASGTITSSIKLMHSTLALSGVGIDGILTALSMSVGDAILALSMANNIDHNLVAADFNQAVLDYIDVSTKEANLEEVKEALHNSKNLKEAQDKLKKMYDGEDKTGMGPSKDAGRGEEAVS